MMSKIIAHRGYSGKYPENTMLAFRRALESGCDGIEFDVHLSRDGVPVIIHDETLDRTTDGTGWVRDYSSVQLRTFNAAARYSEPGLIEPIPTLHEYFELVRGRDFLTNIELKTGVTEYPGIERIVLDMIDGADLRSHVIISSFNHFTILRMKALAPDIKCGFLEESRLLDAAGYCARHGVECMHPYFYELTPERIGEYRAAGIEINAWTINAEDDLRRMLQAEIDGIITNFPELACALRREEKPWART